MTNTIRTILATFALSLFAACTEAPSHSAAISQSSCIQMGAWWYNGVCNDVPEGTGTGDSSGGNASTGGTAGGGGIGDGADSSGTGDTGVPDSVACVAMGCEWVTVPNPDGVSAEHFCDCSGQADSTAGDGDGGTTDGGSTSDSGEGSSSTGEVCEPMLFLHECRQVRAWVKYAPDAIRATQGVLGSIANGGVTHCAVSSQDANVANGPATEFALPLICSGLTDLDAPGQQCNDVCEGLSHTDFGMPGTLANQGPGMNETWDAHVVCLTNSSGEGPSDVGLGNNVLNGVGGCVYNLGPNGLDYTTWSLVTDTVCDKDTCAMASVPEDCYDYAYETGVEQVTSGAHIYAQLDLAWVDQVRGNTAPLWLCNDDRYMLTEDEMDIRSTSSILYRLGLRDGDSGFTVWAHDARYERVGFAFPVSFLPVYYFLVPEPGKDIALTFGFTRNGQPMQLHINVE